MQFDNYRLDVFKKALGNPDLIPLQGKIPVDKKWPELQWTEKALDKRIKSGSNIGCRLSKIQIVIDFDIKHLPTGEDDWGQPYPSPEEFVQSFLKEHQIENTLTVKTANGGYHAYLLKAADVKLAHYRKDDPDWDLVVEIKTHKTQVAAPGSCLKGNYYEVVNDVPPMTCPMPLLNLMKREEFKRNPHAELIHFNDTELTTHLDLIDVGEYSDDYNGWLEIGMACHSATEGEDYGLFIWEKWSDGDSKYSGKTECSAKWDSFNDGGEITGLTLKGIISKSGGKVPRDTIRQQFHMVNIPDTEPEAITEKKHWPRLITRIGEEGNFIVEGKTKTAGPRLRKPQEFTVKVCEAACVEIGIYFDTFLGFYGLKKGAALPWNPKAKWSDDSLDHLKAFLSGHFPCEEEIRDQHWYTAERAMTSNPLVSINSLEQQLESLNWEGEIGAENFLRDCFGCPDDLYHQQASKLFLCGLISRCKEPGVQFDLMLCIEGDQGLSKSSMLAILAGDLFFSDANPFTMKNGKERIEAIVGKWIMEIPEMKGIIDGDTADIKSFLTRRWDEARGAYRRFRTRSERTVVFVGTCNHQQYLKDPTGNRRFLPITAVKADKDHLRKHRGQYLASAIEICKAEGAKAIYIEEGSEMQRLQIIETEKRRILTEFEEVLEICFTEVRESKSRQSSVTWFDMRNKLRTKLSPKVKLSWSEALPVAKKLNWIGANDPKRGRLFKYQPPIKVVQDFKEEEL